MDTESLCLQVQQRSRHVPRTGDIFAMQHRDGRFLFGRVVDDSAQSGFGSLPALLVYVYRARSDSAVDVPVLRRDDLLIPPIMTNKLGWVRGYYRHVRNETLSTRDRFPRHCFDDTFGHYYDEHACEAEAPFEPLSTYGLASYALIDAQIALALSQNPER